MNFNTILSIKIIMKKIRKNRILPPKKPRNAFQFFSFVISEEFRVARNGCKTKRGQVISEISEMWKNFKLDPTTSVLKRINVEVDKDKIRYQNQMIEWHISTNPKIREKLSLQFQQEEKYNKLYFISDVNKLFENNDDKYVQTYMSDFLL
jgi:hypothetical protein